MMRPLQRSKRAARGFTRGKTWKTQRLHRRKVQGTPEGRVEHIKRAYRRKGEDRRKHRRQNAQWREDRQEDV